MVKMSKKKIIACIVLCCLCLYALFATVVFVLFHMVRYNPIDAISSTYIRNNEEFQMQYGEIVHIGKNVLHRTEKSEFYIKSPYTVETNASRVVVYITLIKEDGDWKAVSLEIIDVITKTN